MSVIGRLDEQVEKVLINPIARKHSVPEQPSEPQVEDSNTLADEESSSHGEIESDRELSIWLL